MSPSEVRNSEVRDRRDADARPSSVGRSDVQYRLEVSTRTSEVGRIDARDSREGGTRESKLGSSGCDIVAKEARDHAKQAGETYENVTK